MKIIDHIEKNLKEALVNSTVELLDKNPEKNIDKIFSLIKKTVKYPDEKARIDFVYNYYKENKVTQQFVQDIVKTTDKNCLKKLFVNFFANEVWFGKEQRAKLEEEGGEVPFIILLSPSMRCNLRCTGCYAGNYSKEDDMSEEEVDRLVKEARELGIYYIVILGGEPFVNKYMLDIYEKYNDVMFTPFTNGTMITPEVADRLKELGNVVPMLSLEGFEEETDKRRGKGVYNKVMNVMDMLKERGVLFGVSSAATRDNIDTVTSDQFIDMLIEKGSKMSWYFLYMPVGETPSIKTMLTPEQRLKLGERTRKMRTEKPYFTIDFFNDAPYVGGCIAGKYYCHINSKEDVEPCIFAHFATCNVKDKPLKEAFKTEYFKNLRDRQPYNKNLLLPCMMIDNPQVIRDVVAETGAYPTHPSAARMIEDPEFMYELDRLAEEFKPEAEKVWKEVFDEKGNYDMAKL
jgi:MoaA/NifB/PqqE/SkfB family radical SAM enzyme